MAPNVREMINEVNVMLNLADERYAAAKKAFGVRPNLTVAAERITDAGATVMELASLLGELEEIGFTHPPDVVERVRKWYNDLHVMAIEHAECEHIVNVRSHSGRPQNTLN